MRPPGDRWKIAIYRNREEAGRRLASRLSKYRGREDVVVLGLPRGGVPVAAQVARDLGAPLDVFVVRKLGVPGYEELAMGALASGGALVLDSGLIEQLELSPEQVEAVMRAEAEELARRERLYRGDQPFPPLAGRTVILIDDGLATGSTMRAAIAALSKRQPGRIVVAVPIAPPEACEELEEEVDEVVCAATPRPFYAVGLWYDDFSQTTDAEVRSLLEEAAHRQPPQHEAAP